MTTNERNELVRQVRLSLIVDLGSIVTDQDADDAAHNVVSIAEEHFKPRTITTAEELEALAPWSIVEVLGFCAVRSAEDEVCWISTSGHFGYSSASLIKHHKSVRVVFDSMAAL